MIPLTDFEDRFAPGSCLLLEGAERTVQWSRPGQPGLVVKLHGIDNRAMADLFRGRYLEVPDDAVRALEDGRFYHHQVVGLVAVTSSGRPLGTITEVLERPANDVWVSRDGMVEHLIPATKDAVIEVDLADGRVIVGDWLLSREDT